MSKQIDVTQTDLKAREDTFGSKVSIQLDFSIFIL
jgi:hypothetical protein